MTTNESVKDFLLRRRWGFILLSHWVCLNAFTDRNDQHKVYFCTLPRGHAEDYHDDGEGAWTSSRKGWRDERKVSGW